MNFSIKKKIRLSFLALVFLFIINGVYTVITLNNYKTLSNHFSEVIDPSLRSLDDFKKLLLQSQMFSTNWVFLRYSQADKDSLKQIHTFNYPALKTRLTELNTGWDHQNISDSLKSMFASFEELIVVEKKIMNALQKFDDYDNPGNKLDAEFLIENQVLPRTAALMNSLSNVKSYIKDVRSREEKELKDSSLFLTRFISFLVVIIICIGIFLSVYLTKIITKPINEIRKIVIDLSKGITKKVSYRANGDEIGEMIKAVNRLSDKTYASAMYANEIGKRNFDIDFKPLSKEDVLGQALLSMRNNLKSGDEKLKEAQHIAKLGSWEWNISANKVIWSDELFRIFDVLPTEFEATYEGYMDFVHPDDRAYVMEKISQQLIDSKPFAYECRIITKKGIEKIIYEQSKGINEEKMTPMFGITQDITERKLAEQKLKQQNKELLKINAELDNFVYSVSHDLRAPLSSMLGVVQISEEETKDELILQHLGMLKRSINKLDSFIQDILNYSRNSRLEVAKEEINFKEMLNDITNNLKYMSSNNRRVELKTNINNSTSFCSDKGRIEIVLNNLISNAIRYQNPDTKIPLVNVTVDTSDTETNIIVKDNGIGINKENQEKIFDMFYRVSEKSAGSGLGLYIVKETIDKLKGSIRVESELGKGTTFTIHLPNLMSVN